jgi:hypothetical protein
MYSDVWLFIPNVIRYTPTRPTIMFIEDTTVNNQTSLRVDWEAFTRPPMNATELLSPRTSIINGVTLYQVENITYDVWISDDFALLQTLGQSERANANRPLNSDNPGISGPVRGGLPTYTANFNTYVTEVEGVRMTLPITGDKLYYIRIVARRTDMADIASEPAFGAHYVVSTDPLSRWPLMMNRLPLRLGEITTNTVGIEWHMTWHEIWGTRADGTSDWFTSVGVRNGEWIFGNEITNDDRDAGNVVDLLDIDPNERRELIGKLNDLRPGFGDTMPIRYMDITGCDFEIHTVLYDTMLNYPGGFDAYVQNVNSPANTHMWNRITGFDPDDPSFTIRNLQPNTAYLILFRPVVTVGGTTLRSYLPHHLVATTLPVRPPLDITPTVPVLEPVEAFPMSLRIRFQYTEGLKYELRYSDTMAHYNEGGQLTPLLDIDIADVVTDTDGRLWYYHTIERLFPLTMYYMWIRAYAENSTGTDYSAWSNPIDMTTTDVPNPRAPQGLGPASELHLNLINRELELTYTPFGPRHIAIEWLRDLNHDFEPSANFIETVGPHEILSHPNMTETFMVKFNELRTNNAFYIRAKTVLTVTMTPLGAEPYYQYVVQLADNEDFLDYIELTVPTAIGALHPIHTIVRESAWTTAIRLFTGRDGSDYDTNLNPNMFPLPTHDFDLVWDWRTNTLTMRFRSNQVGADGVRDNLVDQRFITMLMQNRIYDYYVDLTTFGASRSHNGILEIPYTIVSTMEERGITLHVLLDDTTYTFEPGFMRTEPVLGFPGYGVGSRVRFTVNRNPINVPPTFELGYAAASVQRLGVDLVTSSRSLAMEYTARPVTVTQRLTNRLIALDNQVTSYARGARDHQWLTQNAAYDSARNEMSFRTTRLGHYATLYRMAPLSIPNDNVTRDHMLNVNQHLYLRGLLAFNPQDPVPANVLNKILAAAATGAREANVFAPLTQAESNALSFAGWLVTPTDNGVQRQMAIHSLVRLFEARTGSQVRNAPTPDTSAFPDIQDAETRFQTGLYKAERLGFIQGPNADPTGLLTYADMLMMLDYILN